MSDDKKDDNDNKELEIVFAPGCFDDFEGTQEELESMIAEIRKMAASGELLKNSTPVDLDDYDIGLDDIGPPTDNTRH